MKGELHPCFDAPPPFYRWPLACKASLQKSMKKAPDRQS